MVKKKYKVRMNCISFQDLVILADNEKRAMEVAEKMCQCPQDYMEFCEFLPLDDCDKVDYTDDDNKESSWGKTK